MCERENRLVFRRSLRAWCATPVVAALVLPTFAVPAAATDLYDYTFINDPSGSTNIYLTDISNLGHATGWSGTGPGPDRLTT